ncbi:MAG: PDZ domain-containing protein [Chloroflexi bacterium]|nr:PDZ domain-containing protein [Chloroflexota bacterium]
MTKQLEAQGTALANARVTQTPSRPTVATSHVTPRPRVTRAPVATVAPEDTTNLELLYQRINPSVVNIRVASQAMNLDSSEGPSYAVGEGSGFVYDDQGHIVTNNHVVEGAQMVYVTFWDDTSLPAKVIGTDPDSDLAVIQVDTDIEHAVPLVLGDSDLVRVGQEVIAIGNPFGLQGTMTLGIISALGRTIPAGARTSSGAVYTIPDIIQTDAAINPGNSGGPLLNMEGEVIGVNAAIESASASNAGIGFAIPSNIVKKVVPVLIETGSYQHPRLGISTFTISQPVAEALGMGPDQRGVMVVKIAADSPAERAGLRAATGTTQVMGGNVPTGGDIIIQIDGTDVNKFDDLISYLTRYTEVGQTIQLTILRNGSTITVELVLDARS